LLGHDFKGWWIGSLLDIHQTRELIPNTSATSLQVGATAAAAIRWIIENPNEGVHFPETLPTENILQFSKPWLGTFVSQPVDWTPIGSNVQHMREDSVWQFSNFVAGPIH